MEAAPAAARIAWRRAAGRAPRDRGARPLVGTPPASAGPDRPTHPTGPSHPTGPGHPTHPTGPDGGGGGFEGADHGESLEAALTGVLGPGAPVTLPALLARLTAALSATTAAISVDRADGRGPRVLARHSAPPDALHDASHGNPEPGGILRVALPVTRPWTAELTATHAHGRHARAIATLAAGPLSLLVENRRLAEAHEAGRGWLLFLAEAGELLAQSQNVDLTVALIPRLVVPRLGRWCAVHLVNEYGELEVAAQYVPAGGDLDVGGDFYDLIPVPGGGWMLVVGDVSGKASARPR